MTHDELELLARVKVAAPCPVRWSDMQGDDRKRLCGECKQQVHRVTDLTAHEAAALFGTVDARRLCFRRADGTIIAKDCHWMRSETAKRLGLPVALGAVALLVMAAFAAVVIALFGDLFRVAFSGGAYDDVATRPRGETIFERPSPAARPPLRRAE